MYFPFHYLNIFKKSLKILKERSEVVNRGKDNTMTFKNKVQNTVQKTMN